jgi:hypothetical protein
MLFDISRWRRPMARRNKHTTAGGDGEQPSEAGQE